MLGSSYLFKHVSIYLNNVYVMKGDKSHSRSLCKVNEAVSAFLAT